MDIMDILANDNYIIVNKDLINEYGLEEAIIIGELASEYKHYEKENKLQEDNSFYSTVENIEKNTSLSKYQQAKALNNLTSKGIITIYYKGIPPKRYIQHNFEKILDPYKLKNLTYISQKNSPLKIKKIDTNNNNINNNKNNNKENIIKEKFKAPTLEEIENFVKEKNLNLNAKNFYDFFTLGNWTDTKGKKVKNWKLKAFTWANYGNKNKKDLEGEIKKAEEVFLNDIK